MGWCESNGCSQHPSVPFALNGLLSGEIFTSAFDTEPVVARSGARAGAEVLTLDDLDYLVRTAPPTGDWLQLAKSGGFTPLTGSLVSTDGFIRSSAVRKRVAQGFSLVLNHVRRRMKSVDDLCSAVEAAVQQRASYVLKSPLSSNVYATPPNSAAFVPHYDGHGVLVLQLSGSKRWQIFSRMNADATAALPRIDVPLGDPVVNLVLHEGDALYVPRGYPHCAQTTGEHSVHLSLGLQCYTGSDFAWASAHGIRAGQYVPRVLIEAAGDPVRARVHYDRTFASTCSVTEALVAPNSSAVANRCVSEPVFVREGQYVVMAFPGGAARFPSHFEAALREIAGAPRDRDAAQSLSAAEQDDMLAALYQMGFLSAAGQ